MVDFISKPLGTGRLQFRDSPPSTCDLVWITDESYNRTYQGGKSVGNTIQETCFSCHQHCAPGKKSKNTQWKCVRCGMPLCKKKHRDHTCLDEHCCSDIHEIACNGTYKPEILLPSQLKCVRNTRSSTSLQRKKRNTGT